MEDFKEFLDDVMSGDGPWGEEEVLSHWVSEVRFFISRCNARVFVLVIFIFNKNIKVFFVFLYV